MAELPPEPTTPAEWQQEADVAYVMLVAGEAEPELLRGMLGEHGLAPDPELARRLLRRAIAHGYHPSRQARIDAAIVAADTDVPTFGPGDLIV